MDTEYGNLILENVDKLIDALEAHPEDYEEEFGEGEVFDMISYGTPSDSTDYQGFFDDYDEFGEEGEEEEEQEGLIFNLHSEEADYLWDPEKLIETPSVDLEENIARLRKKVESIERNAAHLFRIIEYLTKDPEIIFKLDEIHPFPLKNEKGTLRRMVYKLEKRLCDLEKQQDEEQIETPEDQSSVNDVLPEGKRSKLKSTTILDMFVEPKATNPQLQYVYGNKTNGDIIHILKLDLNRMTNHLLKCQKTNLSVTDSLSELKGCIPSEALCSCVYEVKMMKRALNIMTGGRFEAGEDIIFLNPNRVGDLEKKLSDTGDRLKTLEEVMQKLGEFDKQIKKIRKKFNPYLRSIIFDEPLPGETEQRDVGLDALQERIQVIMTSMQSITDISAQLLKSQEERDNRLAEIRREIERLRYVKVDKEDVEDILTEKADPEEFNIRINGDDFFNLLKRVADFNNSCTLSLTQKEVSWRKTAAEVRLECETKADKEDLVQAKEEIQEDVKFMIEKLREIRVMATRRKELSKQLDNLTCVSCGRKIKGKPQYIEAKYTSTHILGHGYRKKWPSSELQHIDLVPTISAKRISNRYCGSGHTITTPEQRIDREIRPDCEECRNQQ